MKIRAGQTILLTGASGGLGVFMARAFFKYGVNLGLVAYPGTGLDELRQEAEQHRTRAIAMACDLRLPTQRRMIVERLRREFGDVDLLINNAGVEVTAPFHELPEESVEDAIRVNLEAAMILTKLVLPGMLKRGSGHIVNISSLAGKAGPAYQEPYAATKAALIAFTSSLRATYRNTGVSASVIVPGFVEAGIYAKLKDRAGCPAPALLGTSPPAKVVRALIRAVESNLPEVIINPIPVRPLLALTALFPRLGEWISNHTGANEFFRKVVKAGKTFHT